MRPESTNIITSSENKFILESRVKHNSPAEGTNMARELLESVRRNKGRVLLEAVKSKCKAARQWTGAQVLAEAGRLATGLVKELGFKPDQVVALFCEHSADEVLFAIGAVLAGGALLAQQPGDGYGEILTLCNLMKPDVIVIDSSSYQMAIRLRQDVNPSAAIVILDEPADDAITSGKKHTFLASDFRELDESLLDRLAYKEIDGEKHKLNYMLTSGSTGRPKIVVNTHAECCFNIHTLVSATRNEVPGLAPGTRLMQLTRDSVIAGDLPFEHGAGLYSMYFSFLIDARIVIMPSFQVDTFLQAVHDHKITSSTSSTTFAFKLLTRIRELVARGEKNKLDLSSLRRLSCVGAKLAFTDLAREISTHYPNLTVTQCYGLTETGFISELPLADAQSNLDSAGYLLPGIRVKLADWGSNTPMQVQAGVRGELRVWGGGTFKEYKCLAGDDPRELWASCHDEDGFFRTGDQVSFDSLGRLRVHGRIKDTLYLDDDYKVLPAELEEIIDRHPLVEQSIVIGLPDPKSPCCHAPRAFVKLVSSGSTKFQQLKPALQERVTEAGNRDSIASDISEFFSKHVAKRKQLAAGVIILDDFPRLGTLGKVDRRALKLMRC